MRLVFLLLVLCASLGFADHSSNFLSLEPRSSCEAEERKPIPIRDSVIYVPLGHPVTLKCEALEVVREEGVRVAPSAKKCEMERAVWSLSDEARNGSVSEAHAVWSSSIDIANARNHFTMADDFSLNGFFIQETHNASYDCHVITEQAEYVSRITIVVQDCDAAKEVSLYRNMRNPCKYGGCFVDKVESFEVLRCQCIEQYTGEFCEVESEGAIIREIIFYSPFFGHFIAVALLFVVNSLCNRMKIAPRISLADEVPDVGKPIEDLSLLYPAAYLPVTPEQLRDEDYKDVSKVLIKAYEDLRARNP